MHTPIQQYYLQRMGIELWYERSRMHQDSSVVPEPVETSLDLLKKEVQQCQRCPLHCSRTHTVFARGAIDAKLMIIGEAPGFHEDQQGLPFVGQSGALLNKISSSVGFKEEDMYICNILKCRPPNNRDPLKEEMEECTGYLIQQIELVKPECILALGRIAAQFLLDSSLAIGKLRGQCFRYQDIPVVVSYHPSYLLRNPLEKRKAYTDWVFLKRVLEDACT